MDRILEIDTERDDDYDLLPADPVTGQGARIWSEMNDGGDTKDDEFDDFDETDFDDDFDDDFEEELDDDDEFDLDDNDFDNVEFDDEELDEEELTEDFDEDEEPAGGETVEDDPGDLDGEE